MRVELKDILDKALSNPEFSPSLGTTHCNSAVQFIASSMGCGEFSGMLADGIYDSMANNSSGKWARVDPSDAAIWALSNGLSIAALPSYRLVESHGHVAALAPLPQEYSNTFRIEVPMVANVGKTVGYMRTSEAFPVYNGMPDFFTYSG